MQGEVEVRCITVLSDIGDKRHDYCIKSEPGRAARYTRNGSQIDDFRANIRREFGNNLPTDLEALLDNVQMEESL